MTSEERESIINEAVERTLLMIPEVVGNLIMNHAAKIRTSKVFYEKYPELKSHKELVAAVIEEIDDANIGDNFDQIVERAVPEIKRKISQLKNLDLKKVEKPKLDIPFGSGEI